MNKWVLSWAIVIFGGVGAGLAYNLYREFRDVQRWAFELQGEVTSLKAEVSQMQAERAKTCEDACHVISDLLETGWDCAKQLAECRGVDFDTHMRSLNSAQ